MPALRVMGFDGVIPRTSSTMLAENQAQTANNVKLYSKELRYWKGPALAYTPVGIANPQTIHRLYSNVSTSVWLTWTAIVDVAPGPVADVTENRIYYTGEATPRKTNYALASSATPYPAAFYEMGTPAPVAGPTVVASSSASPVETRAYVYTYTNLFGTVTEESAPSPASALVSLDLGATITVSGFTAPPAGNYNWQGRNIYRSVAGATTSTYQFVAYIPLATASYVDSLLIGALGGVLPTIGWAPPPAALTGIISLAGGVLAGFVGNTVWFSQPYYPHAWPSAYSLSLPFNIIGLGAMQGALVAMTTKYPFIISGTDPAAMSVQQLPLAEPCVAKSTIVSNELGVLYASPNGMVSVGAAGASIISNGLFRRDEWQAINPASMKGIAYDGKYFGVFLPPYNTSLALVMNPSDIPMLSYLSLNAQAGFNDARSGNFYIVGAVDGLIYQVDADDLHPFQYTWTSKRFINPQAVAMSALKVDADYTQITANAAYLAALAAVVAADTILFASPTLGLVNDEQLNVRPVNGSTMIDLPLPASTVGAQIFIYGDRSLICGINLSNFDPIRLPAFKAREIYFTLIGNINVRSVEIATSVRDLDPKAWSESAQTPNLWV